MQPEEKEYWEEFGYSISEPVILSFCQWILSEIKKDDSITDVVFVARDGYLPFLISKKITDDNNCPQFHYVYAPRAIAMSLDKTEGEMYNNYIKSLSFKNGTVAVVDSITERFSAQKLISGATDNRVIGLYWEVFDNAARVSKRDCIEYRTFKTDSDPDIPCWPLMEFIMSAPEKPIRTIINGQPAFFDGNRFEETRIDIFKAMETGVMHAIKEASQKKYSYKNAYKLLNKLYSRPNDKDRRYFSQITVSTMPDHSDDYVPVFFKTASDEKSLNRIAAAIFDRMRKSRLNKIRLFFIRRRKEKKKLSALFQGDEASLFDSLNRADIVSFDVFDTMVFRTVDNPHDVFERLEGKYGLTDFKNTRIGAESTACRCFPELDNNISIREIYSILYHFYGEKLSSDYVEKELQEELEVCYANDYIKRVYQKLLSAGKRIIIVSDMYWPEAEMQKILNTCGYFGFEKLFVSCCQNADKYSGKLQTVINNYYGSDVSIAHVGDNYKSDYLSSLAAGWDAVYISKQQYGALSGPRGNNTR